MHAPGLEADLFRPDDSQRSDFRCPRSGCDNQAGSLHVGGLCAEHAHEFHREPLLVYTVEELEIESIDIGSGPVGSWEHSA